MFFLHLIFVLLLSFLLTAVFIAGFRGQRTGKVLMWSFFLIFLATWAGGVWLSPVAEPIKGLPWGSFVAVSIVTTLILTIFTPAGKPLSKEEELGRIKTGLTFANGCLFSSASNTSGDRYSVLLCSRGNLMKYRTG